MIDSRIAAVALGGAFAIAAQANASWNVAGEFQGWDNVNAAFTMTETGAGSGIFELATTIATADPHLEYKISETNNWGNSFPNSGNAWVNVASAGQAVTFTYDTNTYADGWSPASGRYYPDTLGSGVSYNAVGDFQGWNNADPTALMSDIGGGIYSVAYTVATPGTYQYKATNTGGWETQVGANGPNINADTLSFTTTVPNEIVLLQMDSGNGTIRAIPTPGTAVLFGLAGIAGIRRRR